MLHYYTRSNGLDPSRIQEISDMYYERILNEARSA
jgi:hypothetical protein